MLSKAIEIAVKAHVGQVDKGGMPYILHPLRVMMNYCADNDGNAQICAILHDVIEDTEITLDDLRSKGFSKEVIAALDCLTKRDGERYDDFIGRILTNELACRVKSGDLADNMDLSRIPNPTDKDRARIKKYSEAADRITEALNDSDAIPDGSFFEIDGIPNGTNIPK